MARKPSPEIDDELFNEVYGKEYTGPPQSTVSSAAEKGKSNKRPIDDQSDEEDEPRDPNAVPTDFTSREAKVWEAKAKATERNWKKRKEEEMICKICGESGHFTQVVFHVERHHKSLGCPSTLGSNRKTAEFMERVPARDKHVRALFSGKVISQIEKDIGCKIKMDEKFLIVSGKDRLILKNGVDAVHKLIQEDKGKSKSPASSTRTRSKSPDRSPKVSHFRRPESQRCNGSPRGSESQKFNGSPREASRFQNKGFSQERVNEDNVRQDLQKLRGPPQSYANEGAKGRSARSRSPLHPTYGGASFSSYDGHNQISGMHKLSDWDMEKRGTDSYAECKYDIPSYPQTLEEMEMKFKEEAEEMGRMHDKEEDEENYKHRECIRELRENYLEKLTTLRGTHAKQWEEFLQLDSQRRRQARQNAYNQPSYTEYDQSSRNAQYAGSGLPMDSRGRYPYPNDYSNSMTQENFGDFQRQRHDDYGKAYGRY